MLDRTLARLRGPALQDADPPAVAGTIAYARRPLDLAAAPVAITTAARPEATLAQVLAAWPASGFRPPLVVADGPDLLTTHQSPITTRSVPVGPWPTWLATLRSLVDREPAAPAYVIFQDDAVPSRNLAAFATAAFPEAGVLSLATVDRHLAATPGWRRIAGGRYFAGAQALAFSQEAARELLLDRQVSAYRWAPHLTGAWVKSPGLAHIDGVVGEWAERTGRGVVLHSPSLVGHVGERASTIHQKASAHPGRTTHSWPGAAFDCLAAAPAVPPAALARSVHLRQRTVIGNGTHRSGWPAVMAALACRAGVGSGAPIVLDDFVEQTYLYSTAGHSRQPRGRDWCGIFHHPISHNSPLKRDARFRLRELGKQPTFAADRPRLRGAIALCEEVAAELRTWLEVPVLTLLHPTAREVPVWDAVAARGEPTLVQAGFFLRNTRAIFTVGRSGWRRVRLDGAHHAYAPRDAELARYQARPNWFPGDVVRHGRLANEAYDELLTRSVVLCEFYGAAANNLVVECLVRGTPLVCNRLPALEEYLGPDYPLFFGNLAEVHELLDWDRLAAAHRHLLARAERLPSFDTFADAVMDFTAGLTHA